MKAAIAAIATSAVYAAIYAYFKWLPRYDCVLLPVVVAGIFAALDRASGRARFAALVAVSQLFLLAFLVHLWTLGYEGRNAVFGGILPWSDSQGFYSDALRLVHGERFSPASSRRPLYAGLLAILLWIFEGNLRLSLLAVTMVSGFAIAIAAFEVWRTARWQGAVIVYLVLLFFERRFTGFIQSEHFGLPLGAWGFAALWRANSMRDSGSAIDAAAERHDRDGIQPEWLVWSGIFATTLGLLARAGAFFVLPALAWWAARAFPMSGRYGRVKSLLASASAASIAVGINRWVFDRVATGAGFSDYPAIGYGLIHGEDFTYLTAQHPYLASLGTLQRVSESWRILEREAWHHPFLLLVGLCRSELELFVSPYGIFSYVWTNPDDHVLEDGPTMHRVIAEHGILGPLGHWRDTLGTLSLVNSLVMAILGILLVGAVIASLIRLLRRRTEGAPSLLRSAAAGVLASAPFTPPWITSGVQIQTVTLAFVAALPAAFLFAPKGASRQEATPARGATWFVWLLPPAVGMYLVAIALLRHHPMKTPACEPGRAARVRIFDSTRFEVTSARSFAFSRKAEGDLVASLGFLRKHFPEFTQSLEPYVRPGTVFVSAYDACRGEAEVLVDPDRVLAGPLVSGNAEFRGSGQWVELDLSDRSVPEVRLVRVKNAGSDGRAPSR
jgi:hypothetical protein